MKKFAALFHFVHHHFLWLLLGSYAVAALWSALGLSIRSIAFGEVSVLGEKTNLTLPVLIT